MRNLSRTFGVGLIAIGFGVFAMAQATNTFPTTGNVGIGTTSPATTLDVRGFISTGATGMAGAISFARPADGAYQAYLGWRTNGIFRQYFGGGGSSYRISSWSGSAEYDILTATIAGNVGILTTSPAKPLDVLGTIRTSANSSTGDAGGVVFPDGSAQSTAWTGVLCGGDYAEAMNPVGGKAKYEPGDVLVLAPDGKGSIAKSQEAYSTLVAGIFATKPGVIGRRGSLVKDADEVPMAMIGVVPTKVTAENGPIKLGDLLVTSSRPGFAMRGTDRTRMLGAVIGKAMSALDSGMGVIEVLVTLQ